MILTLSATWNIDPCGPLRRSEPAEDLWSLINATGSIMSGFSLFPWFMGESNEEELQYSGYPEDLLLEFYCSDETRTSVVEFLPAIMLATEIALEKAFLSFEPQKVSVSLHPGERLCAPSQQWWDNYFNESRCGSKRLLKVTPELPELVKAAQSACPKLFSNESGHLICNSWGLVESAALISLITSIKQDWSCLSIESLPMAAV